MPNHDTNRMFAYRREPLQEKREYTPTIAALALLAGLNLYLSVIAKKTELTPTLILNTSVLIASMVYLKFAKHAERPNPNILPM